jgi:outer membrane murein-binding lipoprotein Lpp
MRIRAFAVTGAAVAAALLAGCSSSTSQQHAGVSEPKWAESYSNIHDLTAHSDIAVAGSITKVISQTVSSSNVPSTDFQLTVSKVLADKNKSGLASGSTVVIHQTGGTAQDGTHIESDDDPLFKVGEATVLFLHQFSPGHFYVVGGPNGRFKTGGATTLSNTGAGTAIVTPLNKETVQFNGTLDQLASEVAKP